MIRVAGVLGLILTGILATGCVGYYGHPYAGGYYSTGYGYPYAGYPYYGAPYGYGGGSVVISSGGYRGYGNRYYGRHYYPAAARVQNRHHVTSNGPTPSQPRGNGRARTRTANPRTQATVPQ